MLKFIDSKVFKNYFFKQKIYSRLQRDFWKRKNEKILKLKKYLFDKGIYYPSNGIIFLSTATDYKSINTLIKHIKIKSLELKI